MAQELKDTGKKVLGFLGIAAGVWAAYSVLFKKKKVSTVIKEEIKPVQNIVKEAEKITKNLVKGSPEAKEKMRKLREANKTPRGQGRRAKRKAYLKALAGKKGGNKTAELGSHKGHETTQGLVQDQNLVSKEVHEKHYQEVKKDG